MVVIEAKPNSYVMAHKGAGLAYSKFLASEKFTFDEANDWLKTQIDRAQTSLWKRQPIFLEQDARIAMKDRVVVARNFLATIAAHNADDRKLYFLTVSQPLATNSLSSIVQTHHAGS